MKLFKVTYTRMCDPSEGFHKIENQAYYSCESLDRLYNYIENEQHYTVINIEILNCTVVPQSVQKKDLSVKMYSDTEKIIRAM